MATVVMYPEKRVSKMLPVNGVGQPPFRASMNCTMFRDLTQAHIPFSRLHDVGGPYGGFRYVDVPNIFRDFDADPTDPLSYDFVFTDILIRELMAAGVEPFFRLGVTIENQAKIRAYRIYPPKDFHKWAVICEHIIRHYTEGWADGFTYPIRYWEIWNEPDGDEDPADAQMWKGTKEEFYEFYTVASKHLKTTFPHLKIGGYAAIGFYAIYRPEPTEHAMYRIRFLDGFLAHVKQHNAPLDFFSFHCYAHPKEMRAHIRICREYLSEHGFPDMEISLNEWNPEYTLRGTARHAALSAAELIVMQEERVDTAMFYDARYGISQYGAFYNCITGEKYPTYYAFLQYGELYRREHRCEVACDNDSLYTLGASDNEGASLLVVNPTSEPIPLTVIGTPPTACRILNEEHLDEACDLPSVIGANTCLLLTFANNSSQNGDKG